MGTGCTGNKHRTLFGDFASVHRDRQLLLGDVSGEFKTYFVILNLKLRINSLLITNGLLRGV